MSAAYFILPGSVMFAPISVGKEGKDAIEVSADRVWDLFSNDDESFGTSEQRAEIIGQIASILLDNGYDVAQIVFIFAGGYPLSHLEARLRDLKEETN